jgi:hypothetical protein
MDPFRLCLALGPVAVYVLLLGAINLSRRPFMVTGTRDAAALGLAVAGFVVVGPIELFFPNAAAIRFGPYVWLLLSAFYAMCLVLVLLLLRPRLIIYNIPADRLRPILADLAGKLDPDARWAGESLSMPTLGVQLHVDNLGAMRNISLASIGSKQNHAGWRRLETAMGDALSREDVARNPRGISLLSAAVLISIALVMAIAQDPNAVAQSLFDMLRM